DRRSGGSFLQYLLDIYLQVHDLADISVVAGVILRGETCIRRSSADFGGNREREQTPPERSPTTRRNIGDSLAPTTDGADRSPKTRRPTTCSRRPVFQATIELSYHAPVSSPCHYSRTRPGTRPHA